MGIIKKNLYQQFCIFNNMKSIIKNMPHVETFTTENNWSSIKLKRKLLELILLVKKYKKHSSLNNDIKESFDELTTIICTYKKDNFLYEKSIWYEVKTYFLQQCKKHKILTTKQIKEL